MGILRSFALGFGSLPGATRLLQRTFAGNGATILMYHAVTRAPLPVRDWCFVQEPAFREQMSYLHRHCRVVPLREVPAAIRADSARPIVALTFDDGFRNNYEVAFPILQELRLPATIFLATDFIGSDDTVWFCRINDALSRTALRGIEWEGETYDLSTARARGVAHKRLQVWLKQLRHRELLEAARRLITALGDDPGKPIPNESVYRMLAPGEIAAMADSGLVEFGAHSCSHAILSGLSPVERRAEIVGSLTKVETLTGAPCTLFAFPNGRASDFGACDVSELQQRRVSVAVTTVAGPNDPSVPALEMRRYGVGADIPLAHFKLLTHHVLWRLQH